MKKISFLSVSLLSISIFLYEILVVRIYSVFYLSNNLFLIYSLAIFGIGLGGIIGYYKSPNIDKPKILPFILYPFSLASCLVYITNYYYFLPSGINVIITAIPFIFFGFIISFLYRLWSKDANYIFLFDLVGGAFGCFLSLILVKYIGFTNALAALIFISTLVPIVFFWEEKQKFLFAIGNFILILALLIFFTFKDILKVSITSLRKAETPIGWILNYERMKPKLLDTRWDIYSRVDLVDLEKESYEKTMYINGGTEAAMLQDLKDRNKELDKWNDNLIFFPYKFDKNDDVLVLGAGGGRDVHLALLAGAKHVVAVEINKGVVDLVNENKEYTGNIFGRPEVEVFVEDGRTFIMKDKRKYDRIVLSLASTYAFSDLSSISQLENYLYTKEAFNYYFDHLKPDGTLTIFIDFEEIMDKFIITGLSYFENKNISAFNGMTHIVAVSNPELYFSGYSYVVNIKKSPYTLTESNKILEYINNSKFEDIILPYKEYSGKYISLGEGNIELKDFIEKSKNNIEPATDDNPYFMEIIMNFRYKTIFLAISIALIIFILGAFYYQHLLSRSLIYEDIAKRLSYLQFIFLVPYFGFSGMGSMLVEITLIKIFTYYLGYPHLNLVVILFSLLIGFGMGSLWANKFKINAFKAISFCSLILSIILLIMMFLNNFFLQYTIALPLMLKVILVIIYLFPAAFLMGIPFPTAIRLLSENFPAEIPWMWGINGVCSVLGSILSVIISMVLGIKWALLTGVLFYLALAFFAYKILKCNKEYYTFINR